MSRLFTVLFIFLCTCSILFSSFSFSAEIENSQTIKIAVYNEAPFGFINEKGEFGGLMVEIWEDIAQELDLQYDYQLADMETLLSGLENENFDIGLGAITITPQREARVDFSHAVNASGTGIIIPKNTLASRFSSYVWPIVRSIFMLAAGLIALLLVSGIGVWWVERRHDKDPGHRDIDTIEDGLWWSAVTISTIGYGDKVPHTRVGRIVGAIWIFTGLIMLSLFTANASAIFTATEIQSNIQDANDLRSARVGAASKSSGEEYLVRERIAYLSYDDLHAAIDAMLNGDIDCVVSNVPVARYLNNTEYRQTLSISPNYLLENNMGIAMKRGSELRESINTTLLSLITEPEWQASLTRYLGE